MPAKVRKSDYNAKHFDKYFKNVEAACLCRSPGCNFHNNQIGDTSYTWHLTC